MSEVAWRTVRLNGHELRVLDTHVEIHNGPVSMPFWDAFEQDVYEPQTTRLIRRCLKRKPDGVLVDVGAWVGAFSLYAATFGARALALEPDPVAYDALGWNVEANEELCERIDTKRFALVADAYLGPTYLAADAFGEGLTRLSSSGTSAATVTLPLLERKWVRETPIALVKIDVEGYETELAPAVVPWLAERAIPVQISLHGEWVDRSFFHDYKTVVWPDSPYGDVVALPFFTMQP